MKLSEIWKIQHKEITPMAKIQFFNAYVSSIFYYGCEAYGMFTKKFEDKLVPIYYQNIKRCLGIDKYCSNLKTLMLVGKIAPQLKIKQQFLVSCGTLVWQLGSYTKFTIHFKQIVEQIERFK